MEDIISQRAQEIQPFQVMNILAQARALEAQGRDIIHLEIGEPDFATPQPVIDAAIQSLQKGETFYTPALGLTALRERLAQWYFEQYQLDISPQRIVVTPGASGALLLAMGALLDKDHEVLMTDPGYPCNRHFARFVEGRARSVPVGPETAYQLTADHIHQYWQANTQMALVASPSNPTGTVLDWQQLQALSEAVQQHHGYLVVDEIYHGLTSDAQSLPSVLEVNDEAIVVNSFSKFFGMTGWRLGWLVVPESLVAVMDRLAQNLFLAAPTVAQHAALAAFSPAVLETLEHRRQQFSERREMLLPALQALGFEFPAEPQGAFYLYADCRNWLNEQTPDSMRLCQQLLDKTGVAITPGNDFGDYQAETHCRFAFTTDIKRLDEAVRRLQQYSK